MEMPPIAEILSMDHTSIRIAIFAPDMALGGAERSMLNLSAALAAQGYMVDLVLAKAQGPFLADVPATIRMVDLGARRMLTSLAPLTHYLRRERPLALLSILHGNIIAICARRLSGQPMRLVVSERNTLSSESQGFRRDIRLRLMPYLVRRLYPHADCVVAVAQGVADNLVEVIGIPREKVRVIYNPIVTAELRKKAEAPIDHPWLAAGQPPVILAVGRLSPQKDFQTLIEAFACLRRDRRARLLILGEGEERMALESQVRCMDLEQDVDLPGFVANPYPYMVRAAAFVLSSRWEGLPGVLIEAMYCGAPLVATDCPSGPREILEGGQYGRLVPVGDAAALSDAMRMAIDGQLARPPPESWQRFEQDHAVKQYAQALLGGGLDWP